MDKIIDQIAGWEYPEHLPIEYAGFSLDIGKTLSGTQYLIFSYRKLCDWRGFSVLYDLTTKDFLVRVTVGLTEYYDISFITTTLESLEMALATRMMRTLDGLANPAKQGYESIFTAKKILDWPYAAELPTEYAGFRLFISSCHPVKAINGSYIIIDYSDFAVSSNFSVYYNVYRDEFFAEMRLRQTPRMVNLFDTRELDDLAEKLKAHLRPTLQGLRTELG